MRKILFLCTGNYFRSRFSEQWFNYCAIKRNLQLKLIASSAGLNVCDGNGNIGAMAKEAISALNARGVIVNIDSLALPHQVSVAELESADVVVAVDSKAHRPMVYSKFPEWESKVVFWDVKDLGEDALQRDPIQQLQTNVEILISDLVRDI
jgi:protein-tyrosine phosphatase